METLRSADGTIIAYDRVGSGPPIVLVGGATCDRTLWAAVAPILAERATVYAMDRRGRGGSGDRAGSTVDDEIDDVRAVLGAAGPGVVLVGHSSGALLALRVAGRVAGLRLVVAYEPPPFPPGRAPASPGLRALVAAGRLDVALDTFTADVVGLPAAAVAARRGTPAWRAALALAHTVPYDAAIVEQGFPAAEAASVTTPVRILLGGDSPPAVAGHVRRIRDQLPRARRRVLDGQQHLP